MTDERTLIERLTVPVDSRWRTPYNKGFEKITVLRNPDGPEAAATIARQAAEIERLRGVLAQYGRHAWDCIINHNPRAPCTCGWDKARDVLDRGELR